MLFGYMGIDGARLQKGLNNFGTVCKGIERLESIWNKSQNIVGYEKTESCGFD